MRHSTADGKHVFDDDGHTRHSIGLCVCVYEYVSFQCDGQQRALLNGWRRRRTMAAYNPLQNITCIRSRVCRCGREGRFFKLPLWRRPTTILFSPPLSATASLIPPCLLAFTSIRQPATQHQAVGKQQLMEQPTSDSACLRVSPARQHTVGIFNGFSTWPSRWRGRWRKENEMLNGFFFSLFISISLSLFLSFCVLLKRMERDEKSASLKTLGKEEVEKFLRKFWRGKRHILALLS